MKLFSKNMKRAGISVLLAFAGENLWASETVTNLPPAANVQVDFDHDIRPVFEASCFRCHGSQKPKSHFRLDFREAALAGGDDNKDDIVPGDSARSALIAYVSRQVPDLEMPPDG
jgi:hypothetical protein